MKPTVAATFAMTLPWLVAISGCATFSQDGGFDRVAAASHELNLPARWPRSDAERAKRDAEVAAILSHPLAPDDAVQVALLNNPGLQASFEDLGISEADLVESGRLPNPGFSFRRTAGGGLYDVEETLTFNVLSMVTIPYGYAAQKLRFRQAQDEAVMRIAELADQTRTAYYTALAARDSLNYAWQVKNAAQTGAELAHRMLSAGNWNRLDQIRQQSFYLQALQGLERAQSSDIAASAELARLLGLDAAVPTPRLADHLPELPQGIAELPTLEQTAMQNRIDLKVMRARMDELAARLRLTRATRFVNVLDAGPARVQNGTRDAPNEPGYVISLEVPIFDTGKARTRRSEALYAQSVDRLAQAANDARAEVRTAAAHYRSTFELAVRQREQIMPGARQIVKQDLLRYNASLLSAFDLLADARDEIASVNDTINCIRDFWIAKSRLDTALIAGLAPLANTNPRGPSW